MHVLCAMLYFLRTINKQEAAYTVTMKKTKTNWYNIPPRFIIKDNHHDHFCHHMSLIRTRGCRTDDDQTLWSEYLTSWYGTMSVLFVLCGVFPPVTGGFPHKGPIKRRYCIFFSCWTSCWINSPSYLGFETTWRWCDVTATSLWRQPKKLTVCH